MHALAGLLRSADDILPLPLSPSLGKFDSNPLYSPNMQNFTRPLNLPMMLSGTTVLSSAIVLRSDACIGATLSWRISLATDHPKPLRWVSRLSRF